MIKFGLEKMVAPFTNGSLNQRKLVSHTLTGLKRWSCHTQELPRRLHLLSLHPAISFTKSNIAIDHVKALHVYDFDNTRKSFQRPPNHLLSGAYLSQYL